jgi:hypothetical protein
MKKGSTLILSIALLIVYCYLIYKTWTVFGFWTIVWTALVAFLSSTFLVHLVGSRKKVNDVVTFNPKELPKLLHILVSALIGYYLYMRLDNPKLSSNDRLFGMTYLALLSGLPILSSLFKLIRDRNDYISITDSEINYKDNSEIGIIPISTLATVELGKGGIILNDLDGKETCIKTSKMNFSSKDLLLVLIEIKGRIPAPEPVIEEEKSLEVIE